MIKLIRYLIYIFIFINNHHISAQEIKFSYGFDLLYFPEFRPKFEQYSESYKLGVNLKITPKFFLGASYRYAGIAGNFPFILDDFPNISNTESEQEKYIDFKEFKPGLFAVGQKGLHWSQFINITGFDIGTQLYNLNNKFWIDATLGAKLEYRKVNSIRVVVGDQTNGAILTTPEGKESIVQFHTYDVLTSVNCIFNSSLNINQKLTSNSFLYLGTDFNYLLSGDAYWFIDLGIGYKF